jgi:hypothetical protein
MEAASIDDQLTECTQLHTEGPSVHLNLLFPAGRRDLLDIPKFEP